MADPRVDEFLSLEEDARKLVDELKRLREEAGSYSAARESLQEAVRSIETMAERAGKLADEAHRVVKQLQEIGTPELLAEQEATRSQITKTIEEYGQDVGQRLETLSKTMWVIAALVIVGTILTLVF